MVRSFVMIWHGMSTGCGILMISWQQYIIMKKNEPDGYVIYWIAKEVFHIKDMIFNNEEARTGLWNFVAAHFSMINHVEGDTYTDEPLAFLLEDASIKEVISPYYMGRIVVFCFFH